jgi:ribonucleoside-diphosphate reductase beta chain
MRLNDVERNLLTQVFRFFTQSDIEVQDNYMERYARVFRPTEIKMMLAAFANMETVHIVAYALLLETLGMPDSEFTAFMDYEAMRDKHDYMQHFGVDSDADTLRTLAMFGGFTEGLQLFASFAVLLNFPRHNKMRGMGQIVSWSVRDESLHCEGVIRLFHAFASETGALTQSVRDDIAECARTVVRLEDRFIDLAFEMGPLEGLTPREVKTYIRYVADWRLQQLGLPKIFDIEAHPLPWLTEILNGVEHANFFETRATEYAKAATGGDWHGPEGAWGIFDSRMARRNQIDLI